MLNLIPASNTPHRFQTWEGWRSFLFPLDIIRCLCLFVFFFSDVSKISIDIRISNLARTTFFLLYISKLLNSSAKIKEFESFLLILSLSISTRFIFCLCFSNDIKSLYLISAWYLYNIALLFLSVFLLFYIQPFNSYNKQIL